jgi:hypothetical protein
MTSDGWEFYIGMIDQMARKIYRKVHCLACTNGTLRQVPED